ncbi:sigma-54-dependent transcriptional regulator [Cerasicoccus arenae]|uniref:sigma-54-dependent transcriptional regulator n=1 Tax=Cerasicoccus arenae TaxID=424488 RepID=UPI0019032DA2|nr:sigma-54 dependent transcriptional regulator [Cerasicoccus arenae]MBK1858069.1 sigma-54-dependent Fis family transcriptional regulator [Cerasicoccus arenae]
MSVEQSILVIDDDEGLRYSLERVLSARGYEIIQASSGEEGLKVAETAKPSVILLDNRMGGITGIETLQHLRSKSPDSMVILMTAFGTTQTAIEAMKFGAFDYIIKPFDVAKILGLIEKALAAYADLHQAKDDYEPMLNSEDYREGIVGSSEPMQEVFKVIGQVAASDVTVMVTGESGTGKELVARCIYQHSLRNGRPFIAVNCAAIPENLIESELFGHEKGSFTGATTQRRGKFELCDGGTIFLDEIGDMSLTTQTKILRATQEGEIQRVGGNETIKVDVRLIAATNRNLEKLVEEGEFREDLYYRLNVVRLRLPSLRERKEDIPSLIDFVLQKLCRNRKTRAKRFSADAMAILSAYDWPGNVRELENLVYRSAVVAGGEAILRKDLPDELLHQFDSQIPAGSSQQPFTPKKLDSAPAISSPPHTATAPPPLESLAPIAPAATLESACDALYQILRKETDEGILSEIEREMIIRALKEFDGNQVKTAKLLGITRATLRKRIEQMDLKV